MASVKNSSVQKDQIRGLNVRGIDVIRDPRLNKGQAFTLEERQLLGLTGLLAPRVLTQDEQVALVLENFNRCATDLDRYVYIMSILSDNEKLFYRVVELNVETMMPIIYTPVVGAACQQFSHVYRKTQGLYISILDAGHVYDVLCTWPETDIRAIVVTDGERILGLGDLGVYGMGIPIGKLALYTACAGVCPKNCLPITLDCGTNTQSLLKDPTYFGMRSNRVTGPKYDAFIDEFMTAVIRRFGQGTLIQFEDFGNSNAFRLLEKYREKYLTFNDDIQGTAAVAVAGIIAGVRIKKQRISDQTFLFQGAGEAALGIADLLVAAMVQEKTSLEDAKKKIWLVDSKGLVVKNRPKGGSTPLKDVFAKEVSPIDSLEDAVNFAKPSVIIGVAAIGGAFTEKVLHSMASFNKQPIIFALSNPTHKAECTAEQAYKITKGTCVFASGSPFDPVTLDGKVYQPGQGNNAYIFPGVGLAVTLFGVRHIPDTFFLHSAEALADMVTKEEIENGLVYPPLNKIREVSVRLSARLGEFCYANKLATLYPEPKDKEEFVRANIYSTAYESFLPETWAHTPLPANL